MAGDIGERFLNDAEHRRRVRVRELQVRWTDGNPAIDSMPLLEVLHQPLRSRDEAKIVKHEGPQIGSDASRGRHGVLEHFLHREQFCGGRGVGSQSPLS